MTTVDTLEPTVPPGLPTAAEGRRRRLSLWLVAAGVAALVAVLAAATLQVPYVAYAPGSVISTEPRVSVGGGRRTYPSKGEFSFTTVSQQADLSAVEAVRGWLDSSIDVFPREQIFGGQSEEENRTFNRELMDQSKSDAQVAALEHLGWDVAQGNGATVVDVAPGYPAAPVLRQGDLLVEAGGRKVEIADDVAAAVRSRRPGDTIALKFRRDGSGAVRTVRVKLAESPAVEGRAYLGIASETKDQRFRYPFPVNVDSGDVGGPSAGLAFTLSIIDLLDEQDRTHGATVAVTGAITPRGLVDEIGGIAQKTVAAKQDGADVFLVPPGEYEAAREHAGSDLEVYSVSTLDEALEVLDGLEG